MTLLATYKQVERDLAGMCALGVCPRLPAFCCRNDPKRTCDAK